MIQEKLDRAFHLLSEKKSAEAAELCTDILKQAPDHSQALFLLGTSRNLTGQHAEAIEYLRRAGTENVDTFYLLGVSYDALRRHEEAITAYQAALAKNPQHIFSLHNLGMVFHEVGRLDEAEDHLRRMRALSPAHHVMVAANLAHVTHWCLPMNAWPAHYAQTLEETSLPAAVRYVLLISRAMGEWTANDDTALRSTLAEAAALRPHASNSFTESALRYEVFLNRLLTYRSDNAQLYAAADKTLFLVGDSNSLSYAGVRVTIDGADYTVSPHLIVGGKAWHVASLQPNQYTVALDSCIARLPVGAALLCTFGEIDCRIDEGILPHWHKTGGDLEALVTEQVARYVTAMSVRARPRSLTLSFLSVPAPHRERGDRRQVISLFNTALEKKALAAGHRYIDLYRLTKGNDGFSHEGLHIDRIHLKPEALPAALVG